MNVNLKNNVLVVATDQKLKDEVVNILHSLQFSAYAAEGPDDALRKVSAQDFIFTIISDEPSSGLNALGFYFNLLKKKPLYARKAIFIADDSDDEYVKKIKRSGCHFIKSPCNPLDLTKAIENMRAHHVIAEGRHENRYSWQGTCILLSRQRYEGKTVDISHRGLKVHYAGEALAQDEELTISIPDIKYLGKAKVIWHFNTKDDHMVGLDLLDHMDPDHLKKAIPFAS